jgi:hypothetical protein
MAEQGSYPLNGRTLQATDTCTGVVTGQTADIPLSALSAFFQVALVPLSGPTVSRPSPASYLGQPYLDTTLGIMIWASQLSTPSIWIDAAGVQV